MGYFIRYLETRTGAVAVWVCAYSFNRVRHVYGALRHTKTEANVFQRKGKILEQYKAVNISKSMLVCVMCVCCALCVYMMATEFYVIAFTEYAICISNFGSASPFGGNLHYGDGTCDWIECAVFIFSHHFAPYTKSKWNLSPCLSFYYTFVRRFLLLTDVKTDGGSVAFFPRFILELGEIHEIVSFSGEGGRLAKSDIRRSRVVMDFMFLALGRK